MGFFDKIKKGLSRTKKNLIQNIESVDILSWMMNFWMIWKRCFSVAI